MSRDTDWFEGKAANDKPKRRLTILPPILLAAIVGIVLGAVLYAGKVRAADAVRSQNKTFALVRHEAKCDDADITAHLVRMRAGHLLDKFKKATLTYGGRDWRSCWIEVEGVVYSVDETGDTLDPIPASMFKDEGV